MKLFRFTLQRLLDVKEAMQQMVEVRLGDAQRKLDQNKGIFKELETKLKEQTREIEEMSQRNTNRKELSVRLRYIGWLDKQALRQKKNVCKCEAEVEEIRQELLEVLKERKSLERLRKQEMQQWQHEAVRQERNEMDEIASTRFVHQRKSA